MDYIDLIKNVYRVYKECQIKSFPVDCWAVLDHYNFKVFTYSQLKERSKELYLLSTAFSGDSFCEQKNRIIAYNEKMNQCRARFSLMHELGHFILRHTGESDKNERDADEFASHVLAPRPVIKYMNIKDVDDLHEKFGLSYSAANNAWSNYIHRWKWMPPYDEDDMLLRLVFPGYRPRSTSLDNFNRYCLYEDPFDRNSVEFARAEYRYLYGNDL